MDVGGGMRESQIWKHRHSTEFVIGCCGDCITLTRGLLVRNAAKQTRDNRLRSTPKSGEESAFQQKVIFDDDDDESLHKAADEACVATFT